MFSNKTSLTIPQSRLMNLNLFFLCSFVGLTLLLFNDFEIVFYIAVLMSIFIFAFALLKLLISPENISVSYIFATSTLAFYTFGTLISALGLLEYGLDVISVAGLSVSAMSIGFAQTVLVSGALFLFAYFEPMSFHNDVFENATVLGAMDLFFLMLISIGCISGVVSGDVGVQGLVADSATGQISPVAAFFMNLAVPCLALCGYGFATEYGYKKIFISLISFIFLVSLAISGRRTLIFGVATVFLFYWVKSGSVFSMTRKSAIAMLLIFSMLFFGYKFFYALRIASWELGSKSDFFDILSYAWGVLIDGKKYALDDALSENSAYRSLVLAYHSLIVDRFSDVDFMYGALLKFNAILVVPSVLFSGKSAYSIIGFDEELLHPHLNLPVWDGVNSALTDGYADFGIIGLFAYPLLIAFISMMFIRIIGKLFVWRVQLFFYAMIVNQLMNVESSLSTYILIWRDIVMYGIIFYIPFQLFSRLRGI